MLMSTEFYQLTVFCAVISYQMVSALSIASNQTDHLFRPKRARSESSTGELCNVDGRRWCPDGSCLYNYPESCRKNCGRYNYDSHWTCDDGYCILSDHICDGTWHCIDGSDEFESACEFKCGYKQWHCPNTVYCIEKTSKCDGIADCPDNADEEDCSIFDKGDSSTLVGIIGAAVACLMVSCMAYLCKRGKLIAGARARNGHPNRASQSLTADNAEETSTTLRMTDITGAGEAPSPYTGPNHSTPNTQSDPTTSHLPPPDYRTINMYSPPQPSTPLMESTSPESSQDPEALLYNPPSTEEPSVPPPAYTDVMSGPEQYNLHVPGRDPASNSPLLARK